MVKSFLFLELRQNSKLQKRANRLTTIKGQISLVLLFHYKPRGGGRF